MPFDQPTRNRLARFVGDARSLLSEEFTRQLQHEYGMDPGSGDVADLGKLGHLDDARRETARILRATLDHYLAGAAIPVKRGTDKKARQETLQRIVREQAYTVLNRLAALRMAEARGLLIESVGRGYQSRGFQLYAHLAGPALGDTGAAYRSFLFSLFDELAVELPALFDRFSPQGRLFPRETALLRLLDLLDAPDLEALWGEDETLGWIYQYFNSSEERRQMRAESQAPRNSRELAVRNQFFTPRYVVEFLTDNTLGRIWYEMTQGRTALAETCRYLVRRPQEVFLAEGEEAPEVRGSEGGEEALSQEELLRQPVYIPFRPLKDPRDIKMLDSACGSMHFGLYSFDLYEIIYAEAWDLEGTLGASAFLRSEGLKPLRETYADKDALRRDVPRLIIEHNIHGIDIDPRAVQIAGLSLWLRAQRSWQAQGVKPQDRPRIQRSNIVCAEPMPGDKALLEEFLAGLRADRLEGLIRRVLDVPATQQVRATERMAGALCDLVRVVWDEMTLAGEAGSLLKIEQTLANAVRAAEAEWSERMPLFRVVEFGLTGEAERVRYPRTIAGQEEGADFWQQAEALVLAALHDYAEQAQNGAGYQRRLFASDAARGFAFIDLCRRRYDVVLMNPPFGSPVGGLGQAKEIYASSGRDIYGMFVERSHSLRAKDGLIGAILPRTGLFIGTMEDMRRHYYLSRTPIYLLADLGKDVLDDATIRTACLVLGARSLQSAICIRVGNISNREAKLTASLDSMSREQIDEDTFIRPLSHFTALPASAIAYWLPVSLAKKLDSLATLETVADIRQGIATGDNFRFLRLFAELPDCHTGFCYYSKGGEPVPFVSNEALYVRCASECSEMKARAAQEYGSASRTIKNEDTFGRPGITYSQVNDAYLKFRIHPPNSIYDMKGPVLFEQDLIPRPSLLAFLNSSAVEDFMRMMTDGRQWHVTALKLVPIPVFDAFTLRELASLAIEAAQSSIDRASEDETGHFFCYGHEFRPISRPRVPIETIEERIDETVWAAYGANEAELHSFNRQRLLFLERNLSSGNLPDSPIVNLLSLVMGSIYGRWDIEFAIGKKTRPDLPDPYAPLPTCSPAMLQNAHGLPAAPADVPAGYPLRISWPGILVDDPGHPEDIEARVRDALRVIWPGAEGEGNRYSVNGNPISDHRSPITDHRSPVTSDAIEQEACQILGVGSLREYFGSPNRFFDDHLKRYSKSRRQAPIYWPLSTRSGSYTLWLYYHRLSDQMLYSCVNDFVEPRLAEVRDQRSEVERRSGRTAREEKELERLSEFEIELREFRDELLRVAAFWRPNLNDGVQITAAPLWRLFRHRAWQRRLKETWEQLEAGAYDWAHLALSIWPARVTPKCVSDRSLAIAHDLEEVFWVEDPPGKWRNLAAPDQELADQIERRRSPARERLRELLGELGRGRARGLRCADVAEELAAGRWDDLEAALLLWPQRVAEQCWDDPLLAVTLKINLPTQRTKAARERFVKERVSAGCADLAAALEAALRERPDRFAAFWSELARGDHDHLRLALALWPERVVAQCAVDVELAEGHDVRRVLWVRGGEGVWRRRNAIEQEVADEVAQR